jgi:hypothetical protein
MKTVFQVGMQVRLKGWVDLSKKGGGSVQIMRITSIDYKKNEIKVQNQADEVYDLEGINKKDSFWSIEPDYNLMKKEVKDKMNSVFNSNTKKASK